MYNPKVLKYFKNPKNYGEIKNPDGLGQVGNVVCGDVMWLYIKVVQNKKKQDIIKDIKFKTFGCVAALATSSVVTELAKGKTLAKALEINKAAVTEYVGGLPPVKIHCSVLAADALAEAVYNYLTKNKKKISADLKKRHERIKKEKEITEEKYKDWIDASEQKLKKI